jgi:hypothetical protein
MAGYALGLVGGSATVFYENINNVVAIEFCSELLNLYDRKLFASPIWGNSM